MSRTCLIAFAILFGLSLGCAWMNPFRSKTPDEPPEEEPPPFKVKKIGPGHFRATVGKNATKEAEKD